MEKTGPAQELSSISSFFISAPEEKRTSSANVSELRGGISFGLAKEDCEVEETVAVRKRIAYPNTRTAQENIKKELFKFLQEGYAISRIELRRTSEKSEPGTRTVTNEEIALYLR
jgi:hypothetical protein